MVKGISRTLIYTIIYNYIKPKCVKSAELCDMDTDFSC